MGKRPSKKTPNPSGKSPRDTGPEAPKALQQRLLDIYDHALSSSRIDEDLPALLQEVKGHLYARDFHQAFGNEAYRQAYAARWSAGRALAYLSIFLDLRQYLLPRRRHGSSMATSNSPADGSGLSDPEARQDPDDEPCRLNVTCLGGGGGAEAVALAGLISLAHTNASDSAGDSQELGALSVSIAVVDMADWSEVLSRLDHGIVNPPPQSAYASAAARAANAALLPRNRYEASFHRCDVLDAASDLSEVHLENSDVVTLLFTLNELYTISKPKATDFLLRLGGLVKSHALLLVVDSPGSYSTVAVGGDDAANEKKYPMAFLLDHTLSSLARSEEGQPQWEKLLSDESRWFRLRDDLRYPVDLENTRYQIHLFRRL